jgi:hypothetical protein
MPPSSAARTYFDRILTQPDQYAFLTSLINSSPPTCETEWLEFKGNPGAHGNVDDGKPLQIWSEAVSGFANTEGGVLVWGMDCRKKSDRVDAVTDAVPIPNPTSFRALLQENIHQTTDPPLGGIVIREVLSPSGADGFVVCFIPEGENKPYRAEQAGKHKPYYFRVGDSFKVLNPALLRQMFYPKSVPRIRIEVTPMIEERNAGGTQVFYVVFDVQISNIGQSTANELFVRAWSNWGQDFKNDGNHWIRVPGFGEAAGFECVRPLHPGTDLDLCRLQVSGRCRGNDLGSVNLTPLPKLEFSVYCRDAERKRLVVEFGHYAFRAGETLQALLCDPDKAELP